MRKLFVIAVLVLLAGSLCAEVVGTLEGVMKPGMIAIDGDELYISEGCEFSVYSMKSFKKLRQFGKKGEGPGELMELPYFPNKITVLKDKVFVTGLGKALAFTKQGKYISEFRTNQSVFQMLPVGENFVSKEMKGDDGAKRESVIEINVYNAKMEVIKTIYSQDFVRSGRPPRMKMNMAFDFVGLAVEDNKIFIEKSPEGFIIDVFDSNGNKLYRIDKEYEKIKLTTKDKERTDKMMSEDPYLKIDLKEFGGWKGFKKFVVMTWPDYYPAIKGMEVSNGKIYARTYKSKGKNGEKEEYTVMDLKGKTLASVDISRDLEVSIIAQISGGKLYAVKDDKIYYIKENDDEEWDLHVEPLK